MQNTILSRVKYSAGVTLVELLISMGLLSILLIVVTGIFTSALSLQLISEAESSTKQDSQFILNRLQYDVARSTSVVSPATIGNTQSSMTLNINGENWVYSLQNGNLIVTNAQGTFALNGYLSTVSQFDVTRVGNVGGTGAVQITLTVDTRIEGEASDQSVTQTTTYVIR